MGNQQSIPTSAMQGILVQSPLLRDESCIWRAQTTADEAGIYAGPTVADQDTSLTFDASGTPTNGDTCDIRVQVGGYPGLDGPTIVQRTTPVGGSASDYHGHDFPAAVHYHEAIGTWGTAASSDRKNPVPLSLPDGRALMLAEVHDSLVSPAKRSVRFSLRSAAGEWGSWVTLHSEDYVDSAYQLSPVPVLVPGRNGLPDRVQVFHFGYKDLDADNDPDEVRCLMWEALATADFTAASDFNAGSSNVWDNPISTSTYGGMSEIRRLRVAYNPDSRQHLMFWDYQLTSGSADVVTQWASKDGGHRFDQVDVDVTSFDQLPDITVAGGIFIVVGLHIDSGTYTVKSVRVANAFETIDNGTPVDVDAYTSLDSLAVCTDENGTVYLHTGLTSDSDSCQVFRSVDYGATYTGYQSPTADRGQLWWDGGANAYPTNIATTFHRGRVLMGSNHAGSSSPDYRDGASALYLGGWTSVTLPMREPWPSPVRQMFWEKSWTGFDGLEEILTASAINGTQTLAVDGTQQDTTASGGAFNQYTLTESASLDEGIVYASMAVTSGTARITLRCANGSSEYEVRIDLTSSTVDFYDVHGTTSMLGSTPSISGEVEVLFSLDGNTGKAKGWYRSGVTASDDERTWTAFTTTSDPTAKGASPASTRRIRYRVDSGPADVRIRMFNFILSDTSNKIGDGFANGFSNPDDLLGRALTASPTYITDGVSQWATGGRASAGDTFTREPRHTYELENLLPIAGRDSPSKVWRSKTQTADMTIGFQLHDGADQYVDSTVMGVHLVGARGFREFQVIGREAGGTETVLATVDMSESFAFIRSGRTVSPVLLGDYAAGPWFKRAELVGDCWEDAQGTPDVRRISGNSAGVIGAGGTVHRTTIYLDSEDYDGGESTSGTGKLWRSDVFVAIHLGGKSSNTYEGYKLKLRTNSTPASPHGYFEIGQAIIGPLILLADDWSQTSVRVTEARVDLESRPNGRSRAVKRGPTARRAELSITHSHVDMSGILADSPNPDYILSGSHSGAEPIGTWDSAPLLLEGLYEECDGPLVPVSIVAGVTEASGSPPQSQAILGRQWTIYGRMTSAYRREQVFGDHHRRQADRVPTLVVEELT